MTPEAAQILDIVRSVAIGVIAAALLALLILAAFMFPAMIENFRARTRQSVETTVVMPLIERDLAKIAAHSQASENLLREVRDEQRQNTAKLDAVAAHVKRS